jgi:hypothetical protein
VNSMRAEWRLQQAARAVRAPCAPNRTQRPVRRSALVRPTAAPRNTPSVATPSVAGRNIVRPVARRFFCEASANRPRVQRAVQSDLRAAGPRGCGPTITRASAEPTSRQKPTCARRPTPASGRAAGLTPPTSAPGLGSPLLSTGYAEGRAAGRRRALTGAAFMGTAERAWRACQRQVEPSPGADVGGMSPVPAQMWAG